MGIYVFLVRSNSSSGQDIGFEDSIKPSRLLRCFLEFQIAIALEGSIFGHDLDRCACLFLSVSFIGLHFSIEGHLIGSTINDRPPKRLLRKFLARWSMLCTISLCSVLNIVSRMQSVRENCHRMWVNILVGST